MNRVVIPELLDEDAGSPDEIRDSLLDLRGFNQYFGGFSSVTCMLRIIAHKTNRQNLSFLDVAGGAGDVAKSVRSTLSHFKITLSATVLDRALTHMKSSGGESLRVGGDALSLPFADGSFDVVGCNLFCHHLEPDEMISFFNEALRAARMAVITSDLRRNTFHLIAAYAGRFTYRSRITRHDAPVSVRRAYTMAEIASIAEQTRAVRQELRPYYFQRFGLILWKV